MSEFEITPQDDSEYLVHAGSSAGDRSLTLILDDADNSSGGRLQDDEMTAHAVIRYLLARQDPNDLPPRVEVGDVLAAYPDAVDGVPALRS